MDLIVLLIEDNVVIIEESLTDGHEISGCGESCVELCSYLLFDGEVTFVCVRIVFKIILWLDFVDLF